MFANQIIWGTSANIGLYLRPNNVAGFIRT
jgi:hypothetical protein